MESIHFNDLTKHLNKKYTENKELTLLLGELLVHNSVITKEQLDLTLNYQKKKNNREPLGKILIQLGFINSSNLTSFLEKQSELTDRYLEDVIKAEGLKSEIQFSLMDLEPNIEYIANKVHEKYRQINLKTNIQIIDIQHVYLFSLIFYIEFFYRNIFSTKNKTFLTDIISECIKYSLRHFSVEEELIRILDFQVEEHTKDHKRFNLEIVNKKTLVESPYKEKTGINEKILVNIFNYLRDWSLTHIAVRDKGYVLYLEKNENKNEIIKQWARQLQEKNLLQITRLQKRLYDLVFDNKKI